MTMDSLGVAVIGAGMAGRSHAMGYRSAQTFAATALPEIRLVAIADLNDAVATEVAGRYGFARTESSWQAVAEADDIDVVSVVVANHLHREVVEGLLAAGKHVLCEKPFAPTVADGEAMLAASVANPHLQTAVGYTYRRNPAVQAIKDQLDSGAIGAPHHLLAHYLCDYHASPEAPWTWRSTGGPGSGALADLGTHLIDLTEMLCGPIRAVRGAQLSTFITDRALPMGAVVGHDHVQLSDERRPVDNEDLVTFIAEYASGVIGTFTVSRVAMGHANRLGFELFTERGKASFDIESPGEFRFLDAATSHGLTAGVRRVLTGPQHPYLGQAAAMTFPGMGMAHNDMFTFQARAFLEQVVGMENLPRCPSFADGVRQLRLMDAIVASALAGGAQVVVA